MSALLDLIEKALNFEFMINLLIKSSLILGIAGLFNILLRSFSAAIRHWVWSLAFCGLLFIPILSNFLPAWQVPVLPWASSDFPANKDFQISHRPLILFDRPIQHDQTSPLNNIEKESSALEMQAEKKFESHEVISTVSNESAKSLSSNWPFWVVVLWMTGILFLLVRALIEILSLAWISHSGDEVVARNWRKALGDACRQLEIGRSIRIVMSKYASVPVTFGLFRPVILIPVHARKWSDKQRRIVLLHELAHVKRWDYLPNLVAQVVCALYWFNPLIWLAAIQLYLEREQASDDRVLETGAEKTDYARQLLIIAQALLTKGSMGSRVIAMAQRSNLKKRLQHILDHEIRRHPLTRFSAVASLATVILLFVPVTVLHLQQKDRLDSLLASENKQDSRTLENLIADLKSVNAEIRKKAAWSLGEMEDRGAAKPLIEALKDGDSEVRSMAAWALGEIKDKSAVAPLVSALSDTDEFTREMIVKAIGELEDSRAIGAVVEMLNDTSPGVRYAAVWSLGEIGGEQAVEAVVGAVQDPNEYVREMVVSVLATANSTAALEALLASLTDSNAKVRTYAARALGEVRDPGATNRLVATLQDENAIVRQEAARALGKIGNPKAVDNLIKVLRDEDPDVRAMATWALDEINIP